MIPGTKTIASVFVCDASAGVATLMLVNSRAVLMSLWAPSEDDDRILKAAGESSPDQYVLNPNPHSKDESFFADQLRRLGNKNLQVQKPFHAETGMEVLREMLATKELLCDRCDGWAAIASEMKNKRTEKSPQLMALLQALLFSKQSGNQPEMGFGMRLGGGRRGRYDHWV